MLGVGLPSADQRNIADTARQYCLGSAADSPTRSPPPATRGRGTSYVDLPFFAPAPSHNIIALSLANPGRMSER